VRKRAVSQLLTLVACIASSIVAPIFDLHGQQADSNDRPVDPKVTTRITLGSTSGEPGASVVVPIYFLPAEQSAVASARLTINFVSRNLNFSKVDLGAAAEQGNVEINTTAKHGSNEQGLETTTLEIDASVPKGSGKAIPSGLLGYISLNISQSAVPANISLRADARALAVNGATIAGVRAVGAQVEVLAEGEGGMVACFFFTH
jgi:hypothetical protein